MMALAASLLRASEDSSVVEAPLPEAAAEPDDRAAVAVVGEAAAETPAKAPPMSAAYASG
ncbi:MAG: hypothetical protein V5B30_08510 [Candidatus Accumulibacter delftensis]